MTEIRMSVAAIAWIVFALAPHAASAQLTVDISDRPSCRRCEITRLALPSLGEESGEGLIESDLAQAIHDRQGRLYVAGPSATRITVFDTLGRFLRHLGRPGHGPGEFAGIGSFHLGPADSLFVFDNEQSRLSVLSPEGEFVRSLPVRIPPAVTNFVTSDGRFIIGRSFGMPELGPHPLHLFDREGRRLRSFGNFSGESRPDVPQFLTRSLAQATGNRIWSGHAITYEMDRISLDTGARDLVIRREARWFPPRTKLPQDRGTIRPDPMITDIQEDEAGRLWVLLAIPDPEWRTVYRPAGPGESHGSAIDRQGFYDSRVEVLDPVRGTLLAALEMPEMIEGFSGPREVGAVLEKDGIPRFHRWRLVLSGADQ